MSESLMFLSRFHCVMRRLYCRSLGSLVSIILAEDKCLKREVDERGSESIRVLHYLFHFPEWLVFCDIVICEDLPLCLPFGRAMFVLRLLAGRHLGEDVLI